MGEYTFEYALYSHPGDWRNVYRAAHTYHASVLMRRGDEHEGYIPGDVWPENSPVEEPPELVKLIPPDLGGELPAELSFLTLEPETLILSAIKRSEQGQDLIVRFYNPTSSTVPATLTLFKSIQSAWRVNLNEEREADLTIDEQGRTTLMVGGKQVCTVALRF